MKKNRRIVMPLLVFILVIGGWELYVRVFDISLYILPSPSKIISALIENFDILMQHSLVTLEESILGLLISTFFAILISICMDLSKTFKTSIYPYLIVTQTVPIMVLGPLFSIWFGFDLLPKVLIVIFMCFFPIAISFTDALSQVSEKEINLLKSFGANLFQIYKIVKIPSGAIGLFSGLKVAATYCVLRVGKVGDGHPVDGLQRNAAVVVRTTPQAGGDYVLRHALPETQGGSQTGCTLIIGVVI